MSRVAAAAAPATERQIAFIAKLSAERGVEFDPVAEPLTKAGASVRIDTLLATPRPPRPVEPGVPDPEVPAARYAVREPAGEWVFLRVNRPTSGRWAGYTFVDRLYGSPGDFRKVALRGTAATDAKRAIAAATYRDGERSLSGPEAAAVAFSREHGVCAACLAPLTDADSIARGLGPVCATRFGRG